jgi:hypothetical protein
MAGHGLELKSMTPDQAKDLVMFAKSHGIKRLKLGDFEVEIDHPKVVGEAITTDGISQDYKPTEDEMLLYSTPYFDELVEQRRTP